MGSVYLAIARQCHKVFFYFFAILRLVLCFIQKEAFL